jgi:hypothetical protein
MKDRAHNSLSSVTVHTNCTTRGQFQMSIALAYLSPGTPVVSVSPRLCAIGFSACTARWSNGSVTVPRRSLAHALFRPSVFPLATSTGLARSTASLHAALRLGVAYVRVRVAAKSNSTAAGSSSSATTRMNHRSTSSSAWPSRVARYRTGPRSASTYHATAQSLPASSAIPIPITG